MPTTLPLFRGTAAAALALALVLPAAPAFAQLTPAPDDEPTPPALKTKQRRARTPAPDSDATVSMQGALPEGPEPTVVPDSFLPSLMGPVGLYEMSTAEVGPLNHLRLALHGQ